MTDRPTDAQLRGLAVIDAGMLQDDRTANWYITDADLLKFGRKVLAEFGTPPPAVAREPVSEGFIEMMRPMHVEPAAFAAGIRLAEQHHGITKESP